MCFVVAEVPELLVWEGRTASGVSFGSWPFTPEARKLAHATRGSDCVAGSPSGQPYPVCFGASFGIR